MIRTTVLATTLIASAAALAACGSSSSTTATAPPSSSAPADSGAAAGSGSGTAAGSGSGASLAVASTSLGKVVVDGQGMTVYVYDMDTKGATASACTGACASLWPAVEVTGTPQVSGVSGTVGTIKATDGGEQLTIDGWPVYTYASDTAAGDVNGQGVGGIWWAVGPDGAKITSGGGTGSAGGAGGAAGTGGDAGW
jgi:predicted lipoprotein with Yx(FWY)xxD motif